MASGKHLYEQNIIIQVMNEKPVNVLKKMVKNFKIYRSYDEDNTYLMNFF